MGVSKVRLFNKLSIVLGILFITNIGLADEVDINFTTDSGEKVVVSGETIEADAGDEFIPADKKQGQLVRDMILDSVAEYAPFDDISVHIVNRDTGLSEEVVLSLRGEESSVSLVGILQDGSIFIWK